MIMLPVIPPSVRHAVGTAHARRIGAIHILMMLLLIAAVPAGAEDASGQAATTQAKEAGIRAASDAAARARSLRPPAARVPVQLMTGSTSLNISAVAISVPANAAQVPRFGLFRM